MMTHFWPHAVQVGDSAAAAGGAGELTALLDDSSDDEVKQQRKLVCRCLLVKVNMCAAINAEILECLLMFIVPRSYCSV